MDTKGTPLVIDNVGFQKEKYNKENLNQLIGIWSY